MTERSSAVTAETQHYFRAIRLRLERLYDASADNPRLREQLSDEVDWIDVQIEQSRITAQRTAGHGAQWTPDQFWQYVEGLTDPLVRDQMRDMLASKGLSFSSPYSATVPEKSHG